MPPRHSTVPALPSSQFLTRGAQPAWAWRILIPDLGGWGSTWDIEQVRIGFDRPAAAMRFFSSGSLDGDEPSAAFGFGRCRGAWRGRSAGPDHDPGIWAAVELDRPAVATGVVVCPSQVSGKACTGLVQFFDGSSWITTHMGNLDGQHATALLPPPTEPNMVSATQWRISIGDTGVPRWRVRRLRLLTPFGEVVGLARSSGSARGNEPGAHAAQNALRDTPTCWVGTPDRFGRIWIEIESSKPQQIRRVLLDQDDHEAARSVDLAYRCSADDSWIHHGHSSHLETGVVEVELRAPDIWPPDPEPALRTELDSARPVQPHSNPHDDWRILVVVYADQDVSSMLQSALVQAAYPEHLRFEIHTPSVAATTSDLDAWSDDPRVVIVSRDQVGARGSAFLNSRSFYDGERYLLRIGPNCRFAPRWDVRCIQRLEPLAEPRSIVSIAIDHHEALLHPQAFFTRGSYCYDVPFDPADDIERDPVAVTLRAKTSGYTTHHLHEPVLILPSPELPIVDRFPDDRSVPFGPVVPADLVRRALRSPGQDRPTTSSTLRLSINLSELKQDDYRAIVFILMSADGREMDRRTVRSPSVLEGSHGHVDVHNVSDAHAVAGYLTIPVLRTGDLGPVQTHPFPSTKHETVP
ncbi:MAG: hypothetical protein GY926_05860, partial [bacterium]|nr:hypothetical protein [bacterium]